MTPTNGSGLTPKFGGIDIWMRLSGFSRRTTYEELGRGNLKAVKAGAKLLINIEHGLEYVASLPAAKIRAPKIKDAA